VQKGFERVFFFISRLSELCNSGSALGQGRVLGESLEYAFCDIAFAFNYL